MIALWPFAPRIDCARDVPSPIDQYPIRSPQSVHTALSEIVRGKEIVEIGTRNGDGMACFARYAQRAVAIELDPKYCQLLRHRMRASVNFNVTCASYESRDAIVDAAYFTCKPHPMGSK